MSWKESTDHQQDCYFCDSLCDGIKYSDRKPRSRYPIVSSVASVEGISERKPVYFMEQEYKNIQGLNLYIINLFQSH